MAESIKRTAALGQNTPAKCAECPYLDSEHDPLSGTTQLYCQAPWWHPKRWFCGLPAEVVRA